MRSASRRLSISPRLNTDPLSSGVGSFADSLNQALIRNQQNGQREQMQGGKEKSAMDMLMARLSAQAPVNEARVKNLNAGTTEKKAKGVAANAKNQPVTNLDDLFKNDQKTYQAKLQHAHTNWDTLKKNAYTDPELGPALMQAQSPEDKGAILKTYFLSKNADDAAILQHAATHLTGGSNEPVTGASTSAPSFDASQMGGGNGFQ